MRGAAVALAMLLAGCVAAPRAPVAAPPPPAITFTPAPLPPPTPDALLARPDLSGTRAALAAAGLTPTQATAGRTLLAPTDAAWARLPPGTAAALLLPGNRPSLLRLLRYWTLPGRVTPADLSARAVAGGTLPTAAGEAITLGMAGDAPVLTDARGRRARVEDGATSGTGGLLVIDGLIAPASIEPGAG